MQTLRVDKHEAVVTVTLSRPEVHNAFNDVLLFDLTQVFTSLGTDVRAVVLCGDGASFCAGADLIWMQESAAYSEYENRQDARRMAALFEAIHTCARPVIGCVDGVALGGGAGLVACCDIVIATEKARFGFTEVRLGLVPAVISPYVVAKIGAGRARRYFLTGEIFDAHDAARLGLVDEVVDGDGLDSTLDGLLKRICANGPVAMAEVKELLEVVGGQERANVVDYTADVIARLRVSPEGQEGLAAFLAKRKPKWL